jgi:nucleotide-binding universal stress UspA family protein
MFHDIIVPLDGSSLAECAVGRAGWIASECGARLHLVRAHVRRDGDSAEQNAAARAGAAEYLRQVAGWLSDGTQLDVRVAVLDGTPALAIADYADRVDADLVVMTTHGRTGLERRRLGSVASVVAHHVRCPVVLARGGAGEYVPRQAPIERILIAVDGTESPQEVEALALRLGSLGHPRFRILYTLSPAVVPQLVHAGATEDRVVEECDRQTMANAESYAARIARRLRAAGLQAEILLSVTEERTRAMLEAAERDGAGAVVLVRQGR